MYYLFIRCECINASLIYGSLAAVIYLLQRTCFVISYLYICVMPLKLHQSKFVIVWSMPLLVPMVGHNEIRNLTASVLSEVCGDEPALQPVEVEPLQF